MVNFFVSRSVLFVPYIVTIIDHIHKQLHTIYIKYQDIHTHIYIYIYMLSYVCLPYVGDLSVKHEGGFIYII